MTSPQRAPITTHILNLDTGTPAEGVGVMLINPAGETTTQGETDKDGRIMLWPDAFALSDGIWQLKFNTKAWFDRENKSSFFSEVTLAFNVDASQPHYHVPLLLNAFGYSTYRGS
ncbi:hydroxyisourate hydrolase [Teredinibacter turnerae T7901]|uniref:5-hydroxyisourate hydrolase n=1 Tax=Teredinibacter turnerae (strain ATCC 39867 / T7901) TaxID=377629 RepID=C5BIS8_TERTT|nr:hydroxyisourate hydrolase [Teredinibacter turnerae]ACR12749.1 hydroxyisourate hydrolase [Teredinibacter turnerae T7901]